MVPLCVPGGGRSGTEEGGARTSSGVAVRASYEQRDGERRDTQTTDRYTGCTGTAQSRHSAGMTDCKSRLVLGWVTAFRQANCLIT